MKTKHTQTSGFTLIELMVTIALAAILMAIAAPSFIAFQRNAELTSFANSMVASINAAKGEAMKRGRYAMLVPADSTHTHWSSGWIAFVDVDRSQSFDASKDIVVLSREAPPSYLVITPNGTALETPPYVMFDASGYATSKSAGFGNLTFNIVRNDVNSSTAWSETRNVIISVTGRVRACKPTSASDSTCLSSSSQ
jgi:type IV fimbrial biogenesis protein FimT